MKASAPKRKVFQDAIDLLRVEEVTSISTNGGTSMIPVEEIYPFHNHPFRLYEGERLEDMVESIREHGVLSPVIVQRTDAGYEMLAGHNRWNASKIVGLTEIPAIVKEGLSEEEAYIYVIETNLMQRSFTDLLPSEKAAVLAERYDKVLYHRHREAIMTELRELENGGHDVHHMKNRDALGQEYGMTGRNIARYMRLNQLVPELKEKVDAGSVALTAAVAMSYLSAEEQKVLVEQSEQGNIKLTPKNVEALRNTTDKVTAEKVAEIKSTAGKAIPQGVTSIKIPTEIFQRYFTGMKPEDIQKVLLEALDKWHGKAGADV
ncbi:MAG: ParB/RepB/Spo0J family partition protein [Lachnospiraceae bacterium]|nr:ParB/RepB/Spo0J family partition protein [Lachnospiraceae bacterium]